MTVSIISTLLFALIAEAAQAYALWMLLSPNNFTENIDAGDRSIAAPSSYPENAEVLYEGNPNKRLAQTP